MAGWDKESELQTLKRLRAEVADGERSVNPALGRHDPAEELAHFDKAIAELEARDGTT